MMREEKFAFPRKDGSKKIIYPTNRKSLSAALTNQPFFNPDNGQLLVNYFFMGDFLQEMVERAKDEITLEGGGAYRAYVEPYRVPTDIDLQAANPSDVLDLIKQIVKDEKEASYKIFDVTKTGRNVVKTTIDADLYDLKARFALDIVPSNDYRKNPRVLKKVITSDTEYEMNVAEAEKLIAGKITGILEKLNKPLVPYYRLGDFYDIFMMCNNNEVNQNIVNQYIAEMIDKIAITEKDKDKLKLVRDDFQKDAINKTGTLVKPTPKELEKYARKTKVPASIDLNEALDFTKKLIGDKEI